MNADLVYRDLLLKFNLSQDDLKNNVPNRKPYLGIPYPELRIYSKQLFKNNYREFLDSNTFKIYELEIIQTYLIGQIKAIDMALEYFDAFAVHAKEWSVVDSLCQKFVIARKYPAAVFTLIKKYVETDDEYIQRIAAVLILSHFLTDEYIFESVNLLLRLKNEGYFTKMAVAWAFSVIMVKYPDQCMHVLKSNLLEPWTHRKTIAKIMESSRISDTVKNELRLIRSK